MLIRLLRTISILWLVGLLLLGNAPAWIHFGTCSDSACVTKKASAGSQCGNSHCCHKQVVVSIDGLLIERNDSDRHSPTHCLACQAATSGIGVATFDAPMAAECSAFGFAVQLEAPDQPAWLVIDSNHLRGPPAVLA
jgi:hypothetical protein